MALALGAGQQCSNPSENQGHERAPGTGCQEETGGGKACVRYLPLFGSALAMLNVKVIFLLGG